MAFEGHLCPTPGPFCDLRTKARRAGSDNGPQSRVLRHLWGLQRQEWRSGAAASTAQGWLPGSLSPPGRPASGMCQAPPALSWRHLCVGTECVLAPSPPGPAVMGVLARLQEGPPEGSIMKVS